VGELLAVLREALANIARHAQANSARVTVKATGTQVLLLVEDNGIGVDPDRARGGIVNMGERAHDLGGAFEIGPGPDGTGTALSWCVPISTAGPRPAR
jgi:signal transduction histidine kinase